MNFQARYTTTTAKGNSELNVFKIVRDAIVSLVVICALIAYWPLKSVPTGTRGVVTVFGKINSVQNEGMTFLLPWEKLAIFNVRSATVNVDNADGSTSDTQPVKVSMTVRYSIDPLQVGHVYEQYSHDGDLSNFIETATQEVFKAVTARYKATELISKRAIVSNDISAALKTKIAPYGARVLNIDMRNFSLSPSYMNAINDKVTQEQKKLAADNKVATVRAEQESNVAIAEAAAKIVRTKADGDAYSVITRARAEADAIKLQAAALASSGKDILELRRIEVQRIQANQWKGGVPNTVMTMGGNSPPNFLFQLPSATQ